MASVWLARLRGKHGFEKLVAIKTILPKFAADPRFQQMFLDEARIASRHRALERRADPRPRRGARRPLPRDGVGRRRRRSRSCTARSRRRGRRSPRVSCCASWPTPAPGCTRPTSCGAGDGALLGIVHRDVGPAEHPRQHQGRREAHRLRHRQGARPDGGRDEHRRAQGQDPVHGARAGARSAPVDRRADVWAVGAILYHLLSGKPPFEGPQPRWRRCTC